MDEGNKMNVADPVADPNMAQSSSGGNKGVMWIILAVVVVLLVIGGVYYYLNSNKPAAPAEEAPTQTTKVQENLESELDKIEVEDLDKEFSEVDKDLETL